VPDGYRKMHGYGSHTFKMINKEGKAHWVKFHFRSDQGIKNLSHEQATEIAGWDPDYATRDLFNAIEEGDYPSWTLNLQVMPLEDVEKLPYDPFDVTKVWPHADYPLRPVGKMVLNENPLNYHAEVEQLAFSPSHMVPGIDASPDRVLQFRLIAYDDAARYRVGPNFQQLPVNCPMHAQGQNYLRDGPMTYGSNGGPKPNYYPNSFEDLPKPDKSYYNGHSYKHEACVTGRYMPQKWIDQDDYAQPRKLWQGFSDDDKTATVMNIAGHIAGAKDFIIERQIEIFARVDQDLADRVRKMVPLKQQGTQSYTMTA
jgi:catalase